MARANPAKALARAQMLLCAARQAQAVAVEIGAIHVEPRFGALNVGVDDRLTARLASRALLLWGKLQIDGHQYTYIN